MSLIYKLRERLRKKREKAEAKAQASEKIARSNRRFESEREARHMGYTLAVSALSAKLAKADGSIKPQEVKSFKNFFTHLEEDTCETLFNEAALDTTNFEHYAKRMRSFFREDVAFLKKTLAALFDFAAADGPINIEELVFLRKVNAIFGFSERHFARLLEQYMIPKGRDPYAVLGVNRSISSPELKKAYYKALAAYHPDRLEILSSPDIRLLAHDRMTAIQHAYESISKRRRLH